MLSFYPLPGFGMIPINAFLIRAAEPVLVDTGILSESDAFMEGLESIIDVDDIRWVWLTHTDPDHIGSLGRILGQAPEARVVTTFLGMGKMILSSHLAPAEGMMEALIDNLMAAREVPPPVGPNQAELMEMMASMEGQGSQLMSPSTVVRSERVAGPDGVGGDDCLGPNAGCDAQVWIVAALLVSAVSKTSGPATTPDAGSHLSL